MKEEKTATFSPALLLVLALLVIFLSCMLGITHGNAIAGIGFVIGGGLLLADFFMLKRIMPDVLIIPIVILLLSVLSFSASIPLLW